MKAALYMMSYLFVIVFAVTTWSVFACPFPLGKALFAAIMPLPAMLAYTFFREARKS